MLKIIPRLGWLFWAGALIVLLASLFSIGLRHRVEARNKAFSLLLESSVIAEAAALKGITLEEALAELRREGLGGVVLSEDSVRDRVQRQDFIAQPAGSGKIFAQLPAQVSPSLFPTSMLSPTGDALLGPYEAVMGLPAGLRPDLLAAAKGANLPVVARFSNRPLVTPTSLGQLMSWAKENGVIAFLPQGDQVLGFRGSIRDVSAALEQHDLLYLSPEFARIAGEESMLAASLESAVRLHAIQGAEADKLTPGAYAERFGKAFGERNQRFLLLRPLRPSSEDPIAALAEALQVTRKAVEKEGGKQGDPRPFGDPGVPSGLKLAIQAGIAAALAGFFMLSIPNTRARAFLMALSAAIVVFPAGYAALVATVAFPVLAYVFLMQHREKSPWLQLAAMIGISLLGGLAVAGLLNGVPYFVKAAVFPGVKVAHFLPIGVAMVLMAGWVTPWRNLLQKPLTLGGILIGTAGLMIFAIMATRTGNDAPGGVSGLELAMRSALEQFLVVRPRTKEFLIGYPLLIVGLLGMEWSRKRGTGPGPWPLLVGAGSIALTSIVNTLCHLHTPIAVGLTRIGIGAVLGVVFGLIAWAGVHSLWLNRQGKGLA